MFLLLVNKNDNDVDCKDDCDDDGIMLMTTDILPPGEPAIRRPGPDAALEVDVVPLHKVVHQDDHVVYQDDQWSCCLSRWSQSCSSRWS